MKYLLMLFLVWHLEQWNEFSWDSGNKLMMARANELSKSGITHIYFFPDTGRTSAKLIWAEEVK